KGDIAADSIEEQIEARHAEARQLPPDSVEAKDLEASAKTLEVVAMLSKINEKKRRVAMLRAKGDEESIAKANGFEREIHTLVGQAIALEAEVQQLRGTDEALDLRLAAAKMRSDAHTKRAYAEKEIKKEKFERLLAEAKDLENEANQLLAEAERLEK
ncbi:MAG: hypothetical protein HN685_03940, partial [Waddliaceae bacterium]|nr:hypothetical protein [Waddliaceae bacterium]